MKTLNLTLMLTIVLALFAPPAPHAASYGESIENMPRNTSVTVRYETDVPANAEYIILGENIHDRMFNTLAQHLNANEGQVYGYTEYRNYLFETYEATYADCIERHRRYVSTGGGGYNNSYVQNNTYVDGYGNTVVNNTVVNQTGDYQGQTYSYVGPNDCIPPQFTVTLLTVEPSASERRIAEDKTFRVRGVDVYTHDTFYEVRIRLRHDVVKSVTVLTTHAPETIPIGALDAVEDGGWGAAFANVLGNIAGANLSIEMPEPEYID